MMKFTHGNGSMNNTDKRKNRKPRPGTDAEGNFSIAEMARQEENLSEVFFALTRHLQQKFDINRGVLVIKQEQPKRLAAISTWNNGFGRDGLMLRLPEESSLFDKVLAQGEVYTENFCGAFSGNFFERKLLLDDNSRSFVLQPLIAEGQVVGLLGYSSEQPTAFTLFEEGTFNKLAEELGNVIRSKKYTLK